MPGLNPPANTPGDGDDLVQPFQIEASGLRGRLSRLGPLVDDILSRHAYPPVVARLLGETLVTATLLASMLKYDGIFTLQTKSAGPVSLMVVDITSEGGLRGYAQFDETAVAELADGAPLPALLGEGYLAFTVDQGPHTERYQGIVALTGDSLAECVEHYFEQSEQIGAMLRLAVGQVAQGTGNGRGNGGGRWRAGGVMLQRLPDQERILPASERDEGWRRAVALLETCSAGELLDATLPTSTLLYRLFHEDGVRVFPPQPLHRDCRCTQTKLAQVLGSFPRSELEELKVGGVVEMRCEFCNQTFTFDDAALDRMHPAGSTPEV